MRTYSIINIYTRTACIQCNINNMTHDMQVSQHALLQGTRLALISYAFKITWLLFLPEFPNTLFLILSLIVPLLF